MNQQHSVQVLGVRQSVFVGSRVSTKLESVLFLVRPQPVFVRWSVCLFFCLTQSLCFGPRDIWQGLDCALCFGQAAQVLAPIFTVQASLVESSSKGSNVGDERVLEAFSCCGTFLRIESQHGNKEIRELLKRKSLKDIMQNTISFNLGRLWVPLVFLR